MKKLMFVLVALALLAIPSATTAKGPKDKCTTIQDGTIYASTGELITTGYDEFGYNYQAHMFSGRYCDYDRVIDGDYCDVNLIMKWSDTWLSNKDCNGDGLLDRGYSCDPVDADSSACEGAWLTNHQRGEYVNDEGRTCKWTYFVKMVYPPGGPVDANNDGYDDNTGGSIIWGAYVRIQQVSNDPCAGEHGNIFSVQPTGFGAYK